MNRRIRKAVTKLRVAACNAVRDYDWYQIRNSYWARIEYLEGRYWERFYNHLRGE